ncbi:MAG: cyanophycinase [Planctomycetota bacterium]
MIHRIAATLAVAVSITFALQAPQEGRGAVVAVGGGGTPDAAVREVMRLAGDGATVAVVPFASSREDRGVGSVEMWEEAGARAVLVAQDAARAREALGAADVIWMGGGDQDRLLDALEELDIVGLIRERNAGGAVVGGTSAGAAVLGRVSIAGRPDPDAYVRGAMEGRPGLDLVRDAIVDQHFRERTREGRLLTAVLDAGGLLGLGVSERTAAVIEGEAMRVLGEGVIVAFDARAAEVQPKTTDPRYGARGIATAIVPPGAAWNLAAERRK